MKEITIHRVTEDTGPVMGVILDGGRPLALSLENPWKNNHPYISCINRGIYICKRVNSPKFGNTFEVTRVNGRTHILFHKGNVEADTSGCILVGQSFGTLGGQPAVLNSTLAYENFMARMEGHDIFTLTIRDAFE